MVSCHQHGWGEGGVQRQTGDEGDTDRVLPLTDWWGKPRKAKWGGKTSRRGGVGVFYRLGPI